MSFMTSIFHEFFKWQKQNTEIVTFNQASITCKEITHILHEPNNYKYREGDIQIFLLRTSNIFIFNITRIVVNQKYFKTCL